MPEVKVVKNTMITISANAQYIPQARKNLDGVLLRSTTMPYPYFTVFSAMLPQLFQNASARMTQAS